MIATNWFLLSLLSLRLAYAQSTKTTPTGFIHGCRDSACTDCFSSGYLKSSNLTPDCMHWDISDFTGVGLPGGSGLKVWWDIPEPELGCKTLIFVPKKVRNSPNECGRLILQTSRAGCFVSQFRGEIAVGTCCGASCASAGVLRKRHSGAKNGFWLASFDGAAIMTVTNATDNEVLAITPRLPARSLKSSPASPYLQGASTTGSSSPQKRAQRVSFARSLPAVRKRDWIYCAPSANGALGPAVIKSFPPQKVTDDFICNSYNGADCPLQPTEVVNLANTLIPLEPVVGPYSETYKQGQNILALTPAPGDQEAFQNAILTSMEIKPTTIVAVVRKSTSMAPPGETVYLQFIPYYNCTQRVAFCGELRYFEYCTPVLRADGSPDGELSMVITA